MKGKSKPGDMTVRELPVGARQVAGRTEYIPELRTERIWIPVGCGVLAYVIIAGVVWTP